MRKAVTIIEGIIGAGKTTFAKELAQALGQNTLLLLEPDEKDEANPYLESYYQDPARWAFTMQMHLLQARYRIHKHAQWHAMQNCGHAILDRSFYGDTAFAKLQLELGHMPRREFETYQSVFEAMTASVLLPTLCIHLKVSPKVSAKRIARRMEAETGRAVEVAIDEDYLVRLDRHIDQICVVLAQQGTRVLEIPWDENRDDPEARKDTIRDLAKTIRSTPTPDLFTNVFQRVL